MALQKQLPDAEHHLLLPKGHIHLFIQVVVVSLGILLFVLGVVLYSLSFSDALQNSTLFGSFTGDDVLLFSYLISGFAMGVGLSMVFGWALWKFVHKNRYRFGVGLVVSTLCILAAFASVVIQKEPRAIEYTFYFFMISFGMLSGLLSIFYFFRGLSRHVFPTHTHHQLDNS